LLSAKDTDSAYATAQELRTLIAAMVRDALATGGMATVAASAQQETLNTAALGGGVPGVGPMGGPQAASPAGVAGLLRQASPANPPQVRQ